MSANLINLHIAKTAELYEAVVARQLADNKNGVHVEAVRDGEIIIRISKRSERISNDALVALAHEGREITAHKMAEIARKVERKENSIGLLFAKVPLISAAAE